ncbi:acyl-CoA dehydratase activase-related protein [Thermosediminibacter litoriperuensis]|uniref:Putative nucleotide-binding protein (Sugar kinase/HSP70/actin superfamily) n=1 Tax=Thermosediminibacter litoriperuensis TaxID=291989 RepID=A0A5S5AN12_9FIRM|nr:acyl-CoA dehydratase activase-related protein [Thermosediminibacter litoriperuensis]TYP52449.1 putative nucleotide-binding protein (sugar kinase/HSP70/actin superfamily) [Thermosediminibacter litoriperuensis]
MKIGIPRALAYYAYYPFVNTFFEKLGLEVVVSDPTSKEIMDAGVEDAVADACVPIKLFHGHVRNLLGRVDYVFVPRLVSVNREATFCPKFLGLPDMVACSITNLNNMLEVRIDIGKRKRELFLTCLRVGRKFRKGFFTAYNAYLKALMSLKNYTHQFLQGGIPPLGVLTQKKSADIKLGVVGYPYMLYDPYLSLDLIKKLIGMGTYVITPEMVPEKVKQKYAGKLKKTLFWTFSNSVLRTAFHFLETGCVDGIIHVTAFGCGPDFIVDKIMELEARDRNIPYLTIALDEHTGQEGLNTRLEAFVDMLRRKRKVKEAAML